MAKKTVYGTSLNIRQIRSILNKTKALQVGYSENGTIPPAMIIISYSGGEWTIHEDYTGKKGNLEKKITKKVPTLRDYVFHQAFLGQVLIDMMEYSDGNLFSFDGGMLKAEYGLIEKAFSLEYIGQDQEESLKSWFDVLVYENRKEDE